jgi:hypothetical protein
MLITGLLMIAGGLVSAVGIRNPERPPEKVHPPPRAAAAGECGRPHHAGAQELVPGTLEPAPAAAGSGSMDSAL